MSNREVPKGHKQTEIGVIPEDWNVTRLSECLKLPPKYGINAAAINYSDRFPAYIRITDISDSGFYCPNPSVSVNHPQSSSYFLEDGDLVFARTGASVGKCYLYNENDGQLVYAGFLIKVAPDPSVLLPYYLFSYVKTNFYWNWVTLNSMRSGQPGINGNQYGQLPLPLPKIKEQRAIATTLSDVDALIAALEKLIAKKRAIKTATMQQLLTGKKRLPGFGEGKAYKQTEIGVIPEDWNEFSLGDIFDFKNGLNKAKEFFGYGFPIVNYMDVFKHSELKTQDLLGKVDVTLSEKKNFSVKKGDVFFTRTSETVDEIGISSVIIDDCENTVFSGFVLRARPYSDTLEITYCKYCFSSCQIRKQIISKSTYTTRALTNGRILSILRTQLRD